MDLFDAINTRASCRAFVTCTVPDADLLRIVDAARRAPTAFTIQPWHFIVVRAPAGLAALGQVQGCCAQAAAAVIAVGEPAKSAFWKEDLAAAMENMHLAATGLGYASLWVEILPEKAAGVRLAFKIPAGWEPLAALPLGKPASPVKQADRKPLRELASGETFGQPWPPAGR
jgi:nitroreductase